MTSDATEDVTTVGTAVRRSWYVIVLLVLLGAGAGVAAGSQRLPVYTATAQLTVGQNSLTVQSIAGFATGGQAVAESLSRSIGRPEIVNAVAAQTNLSSPYVRSHISSTPVAQTSVFLLTATGTSSRQAVTLVNSVASELKRYANTVINGRDQRGPLLKRYNELVRQRTTARRVVARLTRKNAPDSAIANAQADADRYDLEANSVRDRYNTQSAQQDQGAVVSILQPAGTATNDRSSKAQLLGAYGGAAGLVLGLGLALLRELFSARRRAKS